MSFLTWLVLFGIGVGGILLHVVAKFRDAISKEPKNGRKFKERFTAVWSNFDLLGNLAYGVFALVVVAVLAGLSESLTTVGFPVTKLTILFYGYFADSAFKNLKPESLE